jgi:hypothetical protein
MPTAAGRPEEAEERQAVTVEVGGKRIEVTLPAALSVGVPPLPRRRKKAQAQARQEGGAGGLRRLGDRTHAGHDRQGRRRGGPDRRRGRLLVVVLEAMKMEQPFNAHKAGVDHRAECRNRKPQFRQGRFSARSRTAATDDFATIEVLAAAVRSRLTTATRLQEALEERDRVPARDWMLALLLDIAKGTQSVLEHGYLSYVERAHGLPHSVRQLRARGSRGAVYRDVSYVEYDTHLELDGRLDHDTVAGKDADLDRDLDAAVSGARTARLGWGQVYRRPCVTAAKVARILRAQGWAGRPHACGPGCTITQQFAA